MRFSAWKRSRKASSLAGSMPAAAKHASASSRARSISPSARSSSPRIACAELARLRSSLPYFHAMMSSRATALKPDSVRSSAMPAARPSLPRG